MSTPTATTASDISGILSDIHSGIDQAAAGVDAIVRGVNAVLDALPDVLVAEIRAGVAELQRVFSEKATELGDLLAYAGDPVALRSAGTAWATGVGSVASRLAGMSTLNSTRADDYWTGLAATAYRNTLPAQQAALTAITSTGDEIDATLTDLANAIVNFWVAVSVALLGLGVALIAAAATAATVVGAPVGAGIGIAALVAFGIALNSTISSITEITNSAATRSAELQRRLFNDTAFTGGAWPRSTTPISGDASITDGDGTDWHLA
jgi:hypothetical protein